MGRAAAWSERNRALPPSDAMRCLPAADNRLLRARPPRRPIALAIAEAFITRIYLAVSIIVTLIPRSGLSPDATCGVA